MSRLTRCYGSTTLDTHAPGSNKKEKKKPVCHFLVSKDWEKIGRANIEGFFKKYYNSYAFFSLLALL